MSDAAAATAAGEPRAPSGAAVEPRLRSFWIGGFEGADHHNRLGEPLDMVAASGHDRRFGEDFEAARALGIRVVRESIGWRLAEPAPGRWQLERVLRIAAAARAHGVQVLWTLMHLGLPEDLSLDDDRLVERFAAFAREVATALAPWHDEAPVYTPINEIGLVAWGAASGMFGGNLLARDGADEAPPDAAHEEARVERIRARLVRAALRATQAMRSADPRARFMAVEPLVHVVADTREAQPLARLAHAAQWRVVDQLLGRASPELGGHARALDFVGLSHYASSQWELVSQQRLAWDGSDTRRRALADLLDDAARRHGKPIVLAQTSHVGAERAAWLHEVASQAREALRRRVPLAGVCLYPLVDRTDWDDTAVWHHAGLWDVDDAADADADGDGDDAAPELRRVPVADYQAALRAWQRHLPSPPARAPAATLVVFSRLRWHGVFARPQQLLGRLAERYRIVYVEEPVHAAGPARLVSTSAGPTIEVITPCTPIGEPGFHDGQIAGLQPLLDARLQQISGDIVAWFDTAQALPLAASLRTRATVYDCADEPPGLHDELARDAYQRESALMHIAQLVLVHGPGLFEARRDEHANMHLLPSGVDVQHFAPEALEEGGAAQHEARQLQRFVDAPRLGFYGVIDERIDLALVERLADADAQWQIVMVGPIVGIDRSQLPQRDNLHWLGLQPYAVLPHLLASWDLCLLPLARGPGTRHANPGQALEFLASGKPVVSTAIDDVRTLYGDVVEIAEDHGRFIVACARALFEDATQRREREARTRAVVNGFSWTRCAERAAALIDELLAQPPLARAANDEPDVAPEPDAAAMPPAMPASRRTRTRAITHLVVGGGVTGLAAAWQLGQDGLAARTLLVERGEQLGAAHRRHEAEGCTFEHADLGLPDGAAARALMQRLLGRNLQWRATQLRIGGGATTTLSLPAPAHGGVKALVDACARRLGCQVALGTALLRVMPGSRTARLDDGRSIHFERLISTIPLPDLATACGNELPAALRRAAAALRYRPARSVWLALRRHDPLATDSCLILPGRTAPFHRAWVATVPGSVGGAGRDGLVIVRLDIAPPLGSGEHDGPGLSELIAECRRHGLILAHELVVAHWDLYLAQGHPLDDAARAHHVQSLRSWFAAHGIELAGHFGAWGGDHGLHALEAGQAAVERLRRSATHGAGRSRHAQGEGKSAARRSASRS